MTPDIRGFVPEPSVRGTMGILWSCLLTLIICIWTSIHMNIPSLFDDSRQTLFRRVGVALLTILLPEIIAARAIDDFVSTRSDVKLLNTLSTLSSQEKWTITDGFYANMGGFVLEDKCPIITKDIIRLMKHKYIAPIPSTTTVIMDKSKADGLVNGLACLQATWFVVQFFARFAQNLPISTLELSTVAYVFLTVIT